MSTKEIVQDIHTSGYKFVLAITGGGTEAIGKLLRYGSGSASLLEAVVPYSQQALDRFIGIKPDKYASARTSRAMAMTSFQRALLLQKSENNNYKRLLGIGVTCALRSHNERKERHHEIHISVQSFQSTESYSIYLLENRSREKEEAIGSRLIINIIASSCNAGIKITEGTGLLYEESPKIRRVQVSEEIANLLLYKDRPDVIPRCIRVYGIENRNLYSRKIIFAGSFDPCHKNHIEMARIAAKKYGTSVDFEISIINVDKPPIDYISLEDRITSIKDFHDPDFMGNIFVTNTPLFAEKANIFPNSTFIIGADTMNRLFDPRYYRPHENKYSLLEHFRERHVDFLVFNRKGNEIKVSPEVKSLITIVPDDEYIDDGISSSLIRKMQLNK